MHIGDYTSRSTDSNETAGGEPGPWQERVPLHPQCIPGCQIFHQRRFRTVPALQLLILVLSIPAGSQIVLADRLEVETGTRGPITRDTDLAHYPLVGSV